MTSSLPDAAQSYHSAADWQAEPEKRVILFAMSGLGKTHVSNMLRSDGTWYHYSIDYRIGTRYMGEPIEDNLKFEAMKNPYLRGLLMTDSIYIGSNITFDNLAPVSAFLGKPGSVAKGGLPMTEYRRRQSLFQTAEEAALLDTAHFINRARDLYGYPNFVCDTGGSICEWVDAHNPDDPILTALAREAVLVWIEGSEDHTAELVRRFDRAPKPMAYQPAFLEKIWAQYLAETGLPEAQVDPDAFIRYTYAAALAHRQPRYRAMADKWGVTVKAEDVARATSPQAFNDLIGQAIDARAARA
ncbi:hypothetical protein AQS8620_01692 [Aquimixticola soesokkakensis]|uniref:ATPase n=1 Tax=Aquimixticola soesokkakensis TaxID=1519096 RepID=A0A1Y5SLJ3_9RHOB|nr:ATPase [Aquimixticola soesokkakensis]SLN42397.1 hypothetical protein AQS8620_01692 [Aquimixticola soesokkakensis]